MTEKIVRKFWHLLTHHYYRRRFGEIGRNSTIIRPLQLNNPNAIIIHNGVSIYHFSWLMCLDTSKTGALEIFDDVAIGHFAHIISMNSVIIEKNVLIADKVYISDCTHNYEDVDLPIMNQGVRSLDPVVIGEGTWIGENVCIFGASVGKHCVIGANSVVRVSIPDYCVAVGNPARIIKKYDLDKKEWIKCI